MGNTFLMSFGGLKHLSLRCALAASFCWLPLSSASDDLPMTMEEELSAEKAPAAQQAQPPATPVEAELPTAESVKLSDVIEKPLADPLPIHTVTEETLVGPVPVAADAPANSPFILLGAQVPAATASRLAWSPAESFTGIAAPTPVLVVHGAQPGPTLCLTGAVHGDELNGVEIVRRVMYELDPTKLSGTVIGVPIVNLQGFRSANRYLPDRRDLNRYFPGIKKGSSASRIAYSFFNEVVRNCNMLVDLHTGSFRRTNLPQLRADLKNPDVAALVEHMGAIVVLQSRGAQGSLRRAAVDVGIPAITVEAGEPYSVQKEAVDEGVKSIETLLHKRNMYPQRGLWARKTEPTFYKSLWVRTPTGGILVSSILLGQRVIAGDLLGIVSDPITNQTTNITSPTKGRVIGMAINQIMLPGYAAYHIGYQSTLEEASEEDAGPDDGNGDETPDIDEPLSRNSVEQPAIEAE